MNLFPNRLMNDERQNPVVGTSESEFFPMAVSEHADGTFSIEWDENDAVTAIFNNWTHDDWVNAIRSALENELSMLTAEPEPLEEIEQLLAEA